jgi:hypothetical protein
MIHSKLKILCFITISLMLLFAPSLLNISPDGNAYAMGFLGSSGGGHGSSGSIVAQIEPNNEGGGQLDNELDSSPIRVPEPATMLLLGAGLIGLAGYGRKKFKKE